jgi:photosystem II stability/assembly factor-like uncharacterized protein
MGSWGQGLFRLPPGDSAKWEAYGKNLPQNFITFTTVDSKGTIYCGFDLPGLWFSRDSGATWETTKGTPPEKPSGLAIHPDNPLILLLTTWGKGAWWSEDGGLSWSRDDSPSAFMRKPLAVKSGSQTVFYALSNNQNIVSASGLRGAWKEAAKLPRGLKVWDMAVRDADKGTMLVATDAGIAEIGPDGAVDFPKLGIASAFTRSVLVLPDRVLIGTWGDGVIEWKKDGAKFINDGLADRNAFALCAISAASVGKAETGGATGPATWTAMNNGLLNFKVKNVVASRQNEKVLYCGTDSGVHRSDDGGANWRQVAGGLSDMAIYRVTVSQSNSELVYCSTWNSGVSRSSDGGKSWAQINKGMTTLNTMMVEVDGQNPQTVYAATWGGGLFKSADGGDSWSDFNTGLSSQNTYFVFSGRASPNPVIGSLDTAGLFAFQDGKWVDANKGMNFGWVMWMAQDPANGKRLVACTAGSGIYLSEDGGLSWAQKNTGLTNQQIKSAAFHPGKPGVIYAGTDGGGVFKSTDGGASWAQDNGGLSAMTVRDILITAAGMVYLSTDNGVFARQD